MLAPFSPFAFDRYTVEVDIRTEPNDCSDVDVDVEAETDGGDETVEDD